MKPYKQIIYVYSHEDKITVSLINLIYKQDLFHDLYNISIQYKLNYK